MAYTEEDLQQITAQVLAEIRRQSRTIPDLNPVSELESGDRFEISGGRNIAYSSLKAQLYRIFGNLTEEEIQNIFLQLKNKAFLSRLNDDTAEGQITFLAGFLVGDYYKDRSGACITSQGFAELAELLVRGNSKTRGNSSVGGDLDIKGDSIFNGDLSSPDFISGFIGGAGWALTQENIINSSGAEETKYTLELDNLIIRGTLKVYEMVVSQLVGENDNRVFTSMLKVDHYDPESGIIYLDTENGTFYNPFRAGDLVAVQQYNGLPSEENRNYITKSYEFRVTEAKTGNLSDGENRLDTLLFTDFKTSIEGGTPETLITKGDTIVRLDNDGDPDRKGLIQITTVGSKTPYLDILYGLKTDPDNSLKGRLGNLQGIRHHLFGWLNGFGEYLSNLYAVGDFRLARTGESIDAEISMLKDQYSSQFNQITHDITEEDNLLYNPTFTENLNGWELTDSGIILSDNSEGFLMNGNLMVGDSTKRATLTDYEGRQMLYIRDSGIRQSNSLITQPPLYDEYGNEVVTGADVEWNTDMVNNLESDSKKVKATLYLSLRFLATKSGNLTIGFDGAATDSNSLPNPQTLYVERSDKWQTLQWEGTWDGKGDFVLQYTGEIYVQTLSLTTDPLSDFEKEIGTRIEQTNRNISLLGWNLDRKTGEMTNLGIKIDTVDKEIRLWVESEVEEVNSTIKATEIRLTDEMISMKAELEQSIKDGDDDLSRRINEAWVTINAQGVSIGALEKDMTDVEGRVSQTELDITAHGARLTSNETDISNLTGRVSTAETNIEVNAQGITANVTAINNARGDIEKINGTISEMQSLVGNISSDISDLQSGYKTLDDSLNERKKEIQNISDGLDDLSALLDDIGIDKAGWSSFTQKVDQIEGTVTQIQKTVSEDGEKITELQQGIFDLRSDYSQIGNIYATKGELSTQINSVGLRIDGIEGKFSAYATKEELQNLENGTIYNLRQSVLNLEQGKAEIFASYVTKTEMETTIKQAGFITTEEAAGLYATKASVNSLTGRVEAAEASINVESGRITSAVTRISGVESGIEGLEGDISNINESITLLANSSAQQEKSITLLSSRVTQTESSIESVVGSITAINEDISDIQGNVRTNHKTITAMQSSITQTDEKIESAVERIDSIDGEISKQSTRITQLSNSIELKVDANGVIGAINASAEKDGNSVLKIKFDKINLEGYTTINNSFRIDTNGYAYMDNGASIGGLKVSGNNLTNQNLDNDAYIWLGNKDQQSFAAIGANVLSGVTGQRGVGRFENSYQPSNYSDFVSTVNYGVFISTKNATENIALRIDGGAIEGFNYKNKIVESNVTLDRYDNNILCIGDSSMTITLPAMETYDDGHVVRIKSIGTGKVYIQAQACKTFVQGSMNTRTSVPLIFAFNNVETLVGEGGTYPIESAHDGMEFVWVRGISRNYNSRTYYGMWVQYKFPRSW